MVGLAGSHPVSVHRSRILNIDETGWRSENVNGLVSFPVVHGVLPLDVPVLVIYGQEREKRTSGTRGNDHGGGQKLIQPPERPVEQNGDTVTSEMTLKHSNIDR